jgi:VIT1/CCC1 family predicted Fe2+/Mn2+ transporter
MKLSKSLKNRILVAQKNEITEYFIYKKLALKIKIKENKKILQRISLDELKHYNFWKNFTKIRVEPSGLKIFFYYWVTRLLGLNFGVKLMERGEESAQEVYEGIKKIDPEVRNIIREEEEHEEALLKLLDQEELKYTGSIILGLNDALVELTGVLAGFTLALQQTRIVAIAGLITGVAASLSMGGSEYLSTKDEGGKNPVKASLLTGAAYALTVMLLILPYFVFNNPFLAFLVTISFVLLIVSVFTFYVAVAKNLSFKKRFLEMATISLGVAVINFMVGLLVRKYFNLEI